MEDTRWEERENIQSGPSDVWETEGNGSRALWRHRSGFPRDRLCMCAHTHTHTLEHRSPRASRHTLTNAPMLERERERDTPKCI